jgi:putative hydrolase of HD superfamily
MMNPDLLRQMDFIVELDKLKGIYRQTYLIDGSRNEDDAGHSWHLALMACVLGGSCCGEETDLLQVIKMVLVHDIVEIDAGDTFVYDLAAHSDKREREEKAALRIFGLLPDDQSTELRALWDEFESRETPEAMFAAALDRFQPLLSNYHAGGGAWVRHGIKASQVLERNRHIQDNAPALWEYARHIIGEAVLKGYLIDA